MLVEVSTPGRSAAGRVMSMKNNSITIKKGSREIPDCGEMPDIVLRLHK